MKMKSISNMQKVATLSMVFMSTTSCLLKAGMNLTSFRTLSSLNVLSTDRPPSDWPTISHTLRRQTGRSEQWSQKPAEKQQVWWYEYQGALSQSGLQGWSRSHTPAGGGTSSNGATLAYVWQEEKAGGCHVLYRCWGEGSGLPGVFISPLHIRQRQTQAPKSKLAPS